MPDTDPLELLRASNPFSEDTTPQPQMAPDALFAQITTITSPIGTVEPDKAPAESDPGRLDSRSPGSLRSHRRWRPSIAMPAAAAVVGLVVGGAVLLQPGSTPSASALVADAAATSAGFESGRVMVVVDVVESPGDEMSGSFFLDYRFDNGDFAFRFDGSLFEVASDPAIDEADTTIVGDIDIRGIGDQLFSSFEGAELFFVGPRSAETESTDALFGFEPTSMEPATAVALLESTDDFQAVTSDDGMTTYRGSVTVAALEALGPDSLPAGLAMLADPDTSNEDLPDTLGVDVVVKNGLLDTVTIEIDGDSELGYSKGTITTTFSEFGEPQDITAPPAELISDEIVDGFPSGTPEGFEDAMAAFDELESRRPGLCMEVFGGPNADVSGEDLLAQIDSFPECLEEAGEQAAADAFRLINAFGD